MDRKQKLSAYKSALTTLYSEISRISDEVFIYKITVDSLLKIPYLTWIGIYFFNPFTKEFYLGYYNGNTTDNTVLRLSEITFERIEIINDVETEEKTSICPKAAAECKILLIRNEETLGMIVTGSDKINVFDAIDSKYLLEIAEIVTDKVSNFQ